MIVLDTEETVKEVPHRGIVRELSKFTIKRMKFDHEMMGGWGGRGSQQMKNMNPENMFGQAMKTCRSMSTVVPRKVCAYAARDRTGRAKR